MKKSLFIVGGIGLGVILIIALCAVAMLLLAPVRGQPFQTVVSLPSEMAPASVAPPTALSKGYVLVPPQPTPSTMLGGGTISDGPFIFDLRLYRDPSLVRQPVTPSLYSELEGIGAYMYWFYTGSDVIGPVETYWGTLPQLDQLLQATYSSIRLGSSGGRTGGVLLPGGPFIPGESKAGDRVRVAFKVATQQGDFGAVLAFTLKQGLNGFEPTDISVEVLPISGESSSEEAGVRNVVESFGKRLQAVSLQSPQAPDEIREQYVEFVSGELLQKWTSDPINAPGRIVSSPWPDRIEITSVTKVASDEYSVNGYVVEVTSLEVVNGGAAVRIPVHLSVQKVGGRWVITEYQ